MKYAKSVASGAMLTAIFILLLCIMMIIVDERSSMNVSENDLTWDELSPTIKAQAKGNNAKEEGLATSRRTGLSAMD